MAAVNLTYFELLKRRYPALENAVALRISTDVPDVKATFLVDVDYPGDNRMSFTAETHDEIARNLMEIPTWPAKND